MKIEFYVNFISYVLFCWSRSCFLKQRKMTSAFIELDLRDFFQALRLVWFLIWACGPVDCHFGTYLTIVCSVCIIYSLDDSYVNVFLLWSFMMMTYVYEQMFLMQVECFASLLLDRSYLAAVTDHIWVSGVLEMNTEHLLTAGMCVIF